MPITKEQRNTYRAKYLEGHRDVWNEYLRNYAKNKYQSDPVHREKEKARKRMEYKVKKEKKLALEALEEAAKEEPTIE